MDETPIIDAVEIAGPTSLAVRWRGGRAETIDLAGWLAEPNAVMAPLSDPAVFARAAVGTYGGMVTWDGGEGDLAIDADHLEMIADEQRPFGAAEASAWQAEMQVSNAEAADLIGVVLTTWSGYKSGAAIPVPIARLCRAALRDPIIRYAHLRPRKTGRPRSPRRAD